MTMQFKAMDAESAREIISWRYDGDYHMYNIQTEDIEEDVRYMVDTENHFFAIFEDDTLIGHAVFHAEARVPGGDYSTPALDIGAGMRPDTTGQGKGTAIIASILNFAGEQYHPSAFRATIVSWNERAQKATTNNGFKVVSRFKKHDNGQEFIIFMRDA